MTSDLILTTVSLGLGVAVSHRVGSFLGVDEPGNARAASKVPFMLALSVGLIEFIIIMAGRHVAGSLFTDDEAVIDLIVKILPLMAGFQVLDLANGGAGGVLRGAGKNHQSGICNFIAYYGVGLTTAGFMEFKLKLGLFGLWSGIITGSFALLVLQYFCVQRIDWNREAQRLTQGMTQSPPVPREISSLAEGI